MTCKNKKFGHNFAGGVCLKCEIKQDILSYGEPKKPKPYELKTKPDRGIHKPFQNVAKMLYDHYKGKEKFGLFIGLIKRRGEPWAFRQLSQMKEWENKGKVFPIQFLMKNK